MRDASVQSVSFIIPFYNEAPSLPRLITEIAEFVARAAAAWPLRFDLILIDDGSRDDGSNLLRSYARANPDKLKMRIVRLSRNFGKEIAISAGLALATSDAVILMDADLQHPVRVVESFLEAWLDGECDVVYAYQCRDQREGWLRKKLSRLYYMLLNSMVEVEIPANSADFRLLSRRAYFALRELRERQRFMKGLYSWIGFRQRGIPYTPDRRQFGKSKFSLLKLGLLALEGITSFSVVPLRFAVFAGVLLGLAAGGYGIDMIIEKFLFGTDLPGFPTLIVAIAVLGSAQLIFMGVLGEYVGKILIEVKQRPLFVTESDETFEPMPPVPASPRSLQFQDHP